MIIIYHSIPVKCFSPQATNLQNNKKGVRRESPLILLRTPRRRFWRFPHARSFTCSDRHNDDRHIFGKPSLIPPFLQNNNRSKINAPQEKHTADHKPNRAWLLFIEN